MDDLERQLTAWTEATVAAADAAPVAVEEAIGRAGTAGAPAPIDAGGMGGRGRAWLAAAAVVLVVAALGAAVVARTGGNESERLRSGEPEVATTSPSPTTSALTDPDGGPDDRFEPVGPASDAGELLHVGHMGPPLQFTDWVDGAVVLRAASTPSQLEDLWRDVRHLDPTRSSTPPLPDVDLDGKVVVSVAVVGDACPRSFDGFAVETGPDGAGGTLTRLQPKLVPSDCVGASPGDGLQYVIAVDWAFVGDRFALFVDGSDLAADPTVEPDRAGTTAVLSLDRSRPDPVVIDIELTDTTVAAGSTLPATVRVSNNSGEPVDITYCGAEFAIGLENDEARQELVFPMCAQGGQIPPGTTLYDVTITTTYGTCTTMADPPAGARPCLPDGSTPSLPPGEYDVRLYPPGSLADAEVPPVTVTVT